MRGGGLLHAELLQVIAGLGHGQTIVISDAGLPIAPHVRRIDLALLPGMPGFLAVLDAVLDAGVFEAGSIATELATSDARLADAIVARLGNAPVSCVPHEELKRLASDAIAIVRTGEFTPFANIVLRAGVPF